MVTFPKGKKYSFVKCLLGVLAIQGYYLTPKSKILDFGCKAGRDVSAFRDMGFDAYGFDIHDYSSQIEPAYRKYFLFSSNSIKDKSNYEMDWANYRLPFPDQEFDCVFSRRTFEHVQNHDAALREIYRVMKPASASIHTYAPRYALIEEHMFIPLGSIITNYNYYLFWARCGIRNRFQVGKSAEEVAILNMKYARTGLNYIKPKAMLKKARVYFPSANFIPQIWNHPRQIVSWWLGNPLMRFIYNHMCMDVLFLEKR